MPEEPQETTHHRSEQLDLVKAVKLRQALTATSEELYDLLHDRDPEVVKNILKNPHLTEEHLLALLKRRDVGEELIKSVQRTATFSRSRRIRLALAGHPATPAHLLSSLLPQLFIFELVTLMHLPGAGEDQKLAAERAILKRLPEAELGQKITLARRGTPALLEALLKDGKRPVIDAALANPKIKESGILAFLNSPAANAETISQVARHPRWGTRPNLRFTMLRNPKTPRIWFTLFLPSMRDSDVTALAGSKALTAEQLAVVKEEMGKRRVRVEE